MIRFTAAKSIMDHFAIEDPLGKDPGEGIYKVAFEKVHYNKNKLLKDQ